MFNALPKLARNKSLRSVAIALSLTCALPLSAHAEGFALQDWSARGAASGGLVARGGDASVVAYNPAAMTELPGTQIMFGFEAVAPTNTIVKYDTGESERCHDQIFLLPHGYITHKYSDNISFGFGVFSRFGLGNKYDSDWFGNNNMYNVDVETVTANPNIAWRINDKFSVAFGLEVTAAKVELNSATTFPDNYGGTSYNTLSHSGYEYGYGFNLAAHYRINDKWKAGLTYRSRVDIDFDGYLDMSNSLGDNYRNGTVTLSLPDQFSLAVAYSPIPKLSIEANVSYYVWSAYKNLDVYFDEGGYIENTKNWKDTWMFSLGAEYQVLDWLALRAGVSYETSAITQEYAEYMTPVNGRWKYSVGAGFQKNNWALDIAYVYHDVHDTDYSDHSNSANTDYATFSGSTTNVYANAILVALSYKF